MDRGLEKIILKTDPGPNPPSPVQPSSASRYDSGRTPAPRGYHLFQNGPIKLLEGALSAEIPRRPGSRNGKTNLVTPEFEVKGEVNTRISMAPSSLLASRVTDYRKWVLAVRPPANEEDELYEDENIPSASALLRADTPEDVYAKALSSSREPPLEDQITLEQLQQIMKVFAAVTVDFFAGTQTEDEESRGTRRESVFNKTEEPTRFPGVPPQKYDRKLTTDEFVDAVIGIIPNATRESILELVNKVDYEGVGAITWNELSTFLVSQTSHRTFLSKAGAEFTHVPEPLNCFMDNMHQLVSCYCVDEGRKLIVTGGQEGTVRGWTLTTLSYRGVLFSTNSWITGVHFSAAGRLLYVTTMDREIFLLDSSSFEVMRVYRGRPVEDNTNSLVYAHDTTRFVNVGGIALPTRKALERQLADAAKLNEKRKQELASGHETITSASACEALNFDSMPLTGQGNGPYVDRQIEECVLAGLVDPVTCSAYNHSYLEEEVILLGTRLGDIYFYILHSRSNKKVILSNHVLRVHSERINKLAFFYSMNALISCADDGKVVLTSMVNGQPIRVFQSNQQHRHVAVRDFSFHPYLKMMVTTGPERYGLVWEFSQESPVAVLEAHNSPCRCCTFSAKNSQVVTVGVDGSIFVFDLNGFHLSQKIEPGFAYSPLLISCATSGSLLVFRRYPYHLRIKRHKTSSCPEKYRGHTASMVNILYTRTFDQIVTVDSEFTVMTWGRQNGTNVFTFLLNGYSDSSTLNSAHLTCASLDVAQRRLITGYQNGVVVVWNVVNGQAINFITAGMEEAEPVPGSPRPKTGNSEQRSRSGNAQSEHPSSSLNHGAHRPVRTVGSLVRDGSTFFLFSIDDTLFIVRESSNYTVATASSWKVPGAYGEVTCIIQVTPQVVACGTSLGAVFFFHVLSEKQDGAIRWLPDPITAAAGLCDFGTVGPAESRMSKRHTVSSISVVAQQIIPNMPTAPANQAPKPSKQGNHLTRVTQMFQLPAVSHNTFMTVHTDGTIAFWHTFRRVFVGSLNLTAAGVDEGKDRSGNIVVAVDDVHRILVFGDEGGNIHVCEFHMEMLPSEKEESVALALGNPMMYFPLQKEDPRSTTSVLNAELEVSNTSPLVAEGTTIGSNELQDEQEGVRDPPEPQTPPKDGKNTFNRYFQERAIYLLDRFERVSVFGSNIRSISSLIIAHSPVNLTKTKNTRMLEKQESDEDVSEMDEPVIICTGADSYTRCFTIRGEPIGELGMDPWILGEQSSYRYMGEVGTRSSLQTSFVLEKGWSFDYLGEHLTAVRQSSLSGTRRLRARSVHSGSNTNLLDPAKSFLARTSAGRDDGAGRDSSVHLGASLRNFSEAELPMMTTAESVVDNSSEEEGDNEKRQEKESFFPDVPPGFHHHPGQNIDTIIRRSLRQRILVDAEPFKGVLKRRFLREIRLPNQVADDYFEEPPAPPGMTAAEAQFLGIIESTSMESKRFSSTYGLEPVLGILSEEAVDRLSRPTSGLRQHAVAIVSHPGESTKRTSAQSISLHVTGAGGSNEEGKTLPPIAFQDSEAKTTEDINNNTPVRLNQNRTLSQIFESEKIGSTAPSTVYQNSIRDLEVDNPIPEAGSSETGTTAAMFKSSGSSFMRHSSARMASHATPQPPQRKQRAQFPKYVTRPGKPTREEKVDDTGLSDADLKDPNQLVQYHLIKRRDQILNSGCTESSKRMIEQEMSNYTADGKRKREETLGGLVQMGAFVDRVVEQQRKERGSAALSGALNFIAGVSARMYVPPIQEIEAPVGSKSRDEVQAWRDHLNRLQKNTEAKPRSFR